MSEDYKWDGGCLFVKASLFPEFSAHTLFVPIDDPNWIYDEEGNTYFVQFGQLAFEKTDDPEWLMYSYIDGRYGEDYALDYIKYLPEVQNSERK